MCPITQVKKKKSLNKGNTSSEFLTYPTPIGYYDFPASKADTKTFSF